MCGTPLFPAADSGQDIAVDMKKQSSPQSIKVREINDWTCEETLEVSSRTANQDAMLWGELANGADTAASLQLAERPDDPRCTVSLLRRLSKNAV